MNRLGLTRCVVLILCCISALSGAPRTHIETISGRVIAYSPPLICTNGNGYWSVVVQVPRSSQGGFVRVELSLPCDKTLDWISAKPLTRKFRLIRDKDCDRPMESSAPFEPGDQRFPLWKPVSGDVDIALPFGRTIPCYHSVDFPLGPVM
jgi:hypothetical protein